MNGKIAIIACILSFLLLLSLSQASSVSRNFSSTTVSPSQDVTVNLTVRVMSSETYYAIDEIYPSGWTVMSATGNISQSGHIKWIYYNNSIPAPNTTHSYIIRAPSSTGTYTWSGIYQFENASQETNIAGQTQVTVSASCPDSDGDSYTNSSCGGTDCNDGNANIHPGASDQCYNNVDEDCSGSDAACPGDVNSDHCIDITDLSIVAADFGKTSGFLNANSDINDSGAVDIFDLVFIGRDFGAGCT